MIQATFSNIFHYMTTASIRVGGRGNCPGKRTTIRRLMQTFPHTAKEESNSKEPRWENPVSLRGTWALTDWATEVPWQLILRTIKTPCMVTLPYSWIFCLHDTSHHHDGRKMRSEWGKSVGPSYLRMAEASMSRAWTHIGRIDDGFLRHYPLLVWSLTNRAPR